jgi:hypothetical protein
MGLRLRRADQQFALALPVVLPSAVVTASAPLIANFRSSILSPSFPLFTLHWKRLSAQCKNSGPSGSLILSCEALSSSTPCRFIPAHHYIFSRDSLRSWSRSRIRIVSLPTRVGPVGASPIPGLPVTRSSERDPLAGY